MRLKGPFRKLFGMSKRDHGHHVAPSLEFAVPFVHQNHVNLCGDASVEMLVRYHGRHTDVSKVKQNDGSSASYRLRRNPRGVFDGSNEHDLKGMIEAAGLYGWRFCPRVGKWTAELVRLALDTYGPYAQCVRFSIAEHWVVVKGTDGSSVIYNDPWRGANMSKTMDDWVIAAADYAGSAVAATPVSNIDHPSKMQVQELSNQ